VTYLALNLTYVLVDYFKSHGVNWYVVNQFFKKFGISLPSNWYFIMPTLEDHIWSSIILSLFNLLFLAIYFGIWSVFFIGRFREPIKTIPKFTIIGGGLGNALEVWYLYANWSFIQQHYFNYCVFNDAFCIF
jgi:hypothetical protein